MIPSKFQLAGLEILTKLEKGMILKQGKIGESRYHNQTIALDVDHSPRQTIEQAYVHEVVHWILYVMNEHKLREKEKFVDTFAQLLFQGLQTGLNQIGLIPQVPEVRPKNKEQCDEEKQQGLAG